MNWNSDLSLSHSLTRDLSLSSHSSRRAKAPGKQPRPPSFADEMTAPTPDYSDRYSSRKPLCVAHEETIYELQSDLLQKSHEIDRLRSALNIAACQRSDLLKESELLRHTVTELKSLHRREIAELKAQLANECALRAATDRQLAEAYFTERPTDLRTQVERLACKLQTLEDRHTEQTTVSEGVKQRVVHLTAQRNKMKENYSPQSTERSRKSPHVHRRS